jgi:hypothetical protein
MIETPAMNNGPPLGSAKSEPASHFPGIYPDENAKADVRFNGNGPPWRNPGRADQRMLGLHRPVSYEHTIVTVSRR